MDLSKIDVENAVGLDEQWDDETHRHLHRAWQEAAMAFRAGTPIAHAAHAAMALSHLAMAQAAATTAVTSGSPASRRGGFDALRSILHQPGT